jgi:hypothetical protein
MLLTRGNDKLGGKIFAFNLPAALTCPGKSVACAACYALRGRWVFPTVQAALQRNWQASRERFFAELMIHEIGWRKPRLVRIHSSGDFYDLGYIRQWGRIVRSCPTTRFYAYTRSWRLPRLRRGLEQHLVGQPNVRLWYSADADTGLPTQVPAGVRVAWLQESSADAVPPGAGLVFRVHRLRKAPAKRIGLALVCPTENGATGHKTDCGRCGFCWEQETARKTT